MRRQNCSQENRPSRTGFRRIEQLEHRLTLAATFEYDANISAGWSYANNEYVAQEFAQSPTDYRWYRTSSNYIFPKNGPFNGADSASGTESKEIARDSSLDVYPSTYISFRWFNPELGENGEYVEEWQSYFTSPGAGVAGRVIARAPDQVFDPEFFIRYPAFEATASATASTEASERNRTNRSPFAEFGYPTSPDATLTHDFISVRSARATSSAKLSNARVWIPDSDIQEGMLLRGLFTNDTFTIDDGIASASGEVEDSTGAGTGGTIVAGIDVERPIAAGATISADVSANTTSLTAIDDNSADDDSDLGNALIDVVADPYDLQVVSFGWEDGDSTDLRLEFFSDLTPDHFDVSLYWTSLPEGCPSNCPEGWYQQVYDGPPIVATTSNTLPNQSITEISPGFYEATISSSQLKSAPGGKTDLVVHLGSGKLSRGFLAREQGVVYEFPENRADNFAALSPDLRIDWIDWGAPDGVRGEYQIKSFADLGSPLQMGLFWSADRAYDTGDKRAAKFPLGKLGPGKHPFNLPGAQFNSAPEELESTPGLSHEYLVGLIDPDDDFSESDETNNGKNITPNLSSKTAFEFVVDLPERRWTLNETLVVTSFVRNRSPFPVRFDLVGEFAGIGRGFQKPDASKQAFTLWPGQGKYYSDAVKLRWDWIPEKSPLESAEGKELMANIARDLLGNLKNVPRVKNIETLVDLGEFLREAFRMPSEFFALREYLDLDFESGLSPNVKGVADEKRRVEASPGVPKLKQDKFKESVAEIMRLMRESKNPLNLNSQASLDRVLNDAYQKSISLWRAAWDPPEPEYKSLAVPELEFPEELLNLPANPLTNPYRFRFREVSLSMTESVASDRFDAANQEGDAIWKTEQLISLSNFAHRAVFEMHGELAYSVFLRPYVDANFPSEAELLQQYQASGFSDEAENLLLNAGANSESIQVIDSYLRNVTADDVAGVSSSGLIGFDINSLLYRVNLSAGGLRDAIAERIDSLGFIPRALTTNEATLLASHEAQLLQMQQTGIPSGEYFGLLEQYSSDARRIALSSGNFDAVEPHLLKAYLGLISETGLGRKTSRFADFASAGVSSGRLAQSAFEKLELQLQKVSQANAMANWEGLALELGVLETMVNCIDVNDVTEEFRLEMLEYIGSLNDANVLQPSPTNVDLTTESERLLIPAGYPTLSLGDAEVVDRQIGNLSGGMLRVTLSNAQNGGKVSLDLSDDFAMTDEGLILHKGLQFGVASGGQVGEPLVVSFLAGADATNVQELIRGVAIEFPSDAQGQSELSLELMNGLREASSNSALKILPVSIYAAPTIGSVRVGDGSGSRSQVRSVTVTYDRIVNHQELKSAFEVRNVDTGTSVGQVTVTSSNTNGVTVSELRFSGASTTEALHQGAEPPSLVDGNYSLIVKASSVTLPLGGGMVNDFVVDRASSSEETIDDFFRLFGDTDGDRDVDGQDYGRFGLSFLKTSNDPAYDPRLDFDGDGDVDGQDYGRFGLNFLRNI